MLLPVKSPNLTQEDVEIRGHAIEVRLYAEDAANGFLPQTGDLLRFDIAELDGCRTDHGVVQGQKVTPHYDPMLAKLIAWGPDRETARRKLNRMLRDSHILGMVTNQGFLTKALNAEDFVKGEATTALIADWFTDEIKDSLEELTAAQWLIAGTLLKLGEHSAEQSKLPRGFRNSITFPTQTQLSIGEKDELLEISMTQSSAGVEVKGSVLGESVEMTILRWDGKHCIYEIGGVSRKLGYLRNGAKVYLSAGQGSVCLRTRPSATAARRRCWQR